MDKLTAKYDNSVQGIVQWACDMAQVDFSELHPRYVTITWDDGTQSTADEDHLGDAKPVSFSIAHPDLDEPVVVEVGKRQ